MAQHHSNNSFNNVGSIFEYLFGKRSDKENDTEDEDPLSKSLTELRVKLTHSVGQYAHKLDDLNENQWIVLLVNIGKNYGGFKSRFVMKIQKKYVDKLTSNKISFGEFQEHVEIYDEELYLK